MFYKLYLCGFYKGGFIQGTYSISGIEQEIAIHGMLPNFIGVIKRVGKMYDEEISIYSWDRHESKGCIRCGNGSSGIRIVHNPSGKFVCCDAFPSQIKNKQKAEQMLKYILAFKTGNVISAVNDENAPGHWHCSFKRL